MPNTNPRWKKSERAIAAKLGGRRVPVNGRGNSPDVAHPLFSVECKDREHLPVWARETQMRAILKGAEWADFLTITGELDDEPCCPACWNLKRDGKHDEGCWLGKALALVTPNLLPGQG